MCVCVCVFITGEVCVFIGSGPGPVRDFGTERALAEPLGPIYIGFQNSWTRGTLLTELNLTVPKARPEVHTFDFIGLPFDFIGITAGNRAWFYHMGQSGNGDSRHGHSV